jgi:hypothetical protein
MHPFGCDPESAALLPISVSGPLLLRDRGTNLGEADRLLVKCFSDMLYDILGLAVASIEFLFRC